MKIYQVGMDYRCGRAFEDWAARDMSDYLLVVHRGNATAECIYGAGDDACELSLWLKDPRCRAILFVRGTPYGGIGRLKCEELARETRGKVHVLSYAVDPAQGSLEVSPLFRERMARLCHAAEEDDTVDWALVDPAIKEALLGLYLVMSAATLMDARGISSEIVLRDPAIPRLCELAQEELRTAGDSKLDIPEEITAAVARRLSATLRALVAGEIQ